MGADLEVQGSGQDRFQVNTWWIAVQAQYSKELSMDFKHEAVLVKWKAFCNIWKA